MAHPAVTGRPRGRISRVLLALCILYGYASGDSGHALATYSEDAVKAAFVYRFAGYVKWPDEVLPPDKFTIAVLGEGEVAANLQALSAGRTLLNRPVQVRQVASIRQADGAQILYVGNDRRSLLHMLRPGPARGTLVVTDADGALAAGSAINLLVIEHRVRFEISLEAAQQAGLKISSDLLALAVQVQQ